MGVPHFSVPCIQSAISVMCPFLLFITWYLVLSLQWLPGRWFSIALKRLNTSFSLLGHFYLSFIFSSCLFELKSLQTVLKRSGLLY